MITVVGSPAWRATEPQGPAGRACEIALAAAAAGARVELVGRVGDDPAGDRLLIALARGSVGHAAILRDPTHPTALALPGPDAADDDDPFSDAADDEDVAPAGLAATLPGPRLEPADVTLGLRYISGFDVLVVADDAPVAVIPAAAEAAGFAGARLLVLVAPGVVTPHLPDDALVLGAPGADDGAFGTLVGAVAAGLDRGLSPADALRASTGAAGWETVPADAG